MDAALMRKCIAADNGLVQLDVHAGVALDHLGMGECASCSVRNFTQGSRKVRSDSKRRHKRRQATILGWWW
jgi:hypothetical protein